jgi:hypothetical protein
MLLRQFDSVGVFLVALVLFCKDLFQPLCLLLRNPSIHRSGIVAQDELLTAAITPERRHLLQPSSFLSATLLYGHCSPSNAPSLLIVTSAISARLSQTQTLERRSSTTR